MTLFALILALLLEQLRPLQQRSSVDDWLCRLCARAVEMYDDHSFANGRVAWLLVIGAGSGAVWLIHFLLDALHPLLAFVFSAAVLYLLLGFRRDEVMFTDIQRALADDDADAAAQRLHDWDGGKHAGAPVGQLARVTVEHALLRAHRGIYGVLFWFVILPGPVGVVMYRLARQFGHACAARPDAAESAFGGFAARAWEVLDAVPARLTAVAFAVIGHFEDAVLCWRTQAALWPERSAGIVLAAGGGALGLRLGMPLRSGDTVIDRPELGLGAAADVDQMPRVARMIWRVLVVYVLVVALLTIAGWVGQ